MKKVLSVLVALLLLISVPASAASKKPPKVKPQKVNYIEKNVDIKLNAVLGNNNGIQEWTLTALVPKRGSSISYGWPLPSNTEGLDDQFIKLLNNNSNISYKSGIYTVTTKFKQCDYPNVSRITFKAVMNAGNSHIRFVGAKTIDLTKAPTQPQTPSYEFSSGTIPTIILPYQDITFPLSLKVKNSNNIVAKVNVSSIGDKQKMIITANNKDLLSTQQLGDIFIINKDYESKTDITAKFTAAGTYSVTFSLVNLADNSVLAAKTISFTVYSSQNDIIDKLDIIKLKLTPNDSTKGLYNLFADKILITYKNGSSIIITNYNTPLAVIDINKLNTPDYYVPVNIIYNNTSYPFILTSKQIINLLIKE